MLHWEWKWGLDPNYFIALVHISLSSGFSQNILFYLTHSFWRQGLYGAQVVSELLCRLELVYLCFLRAGLIACATHLAQEFLKEIMCMSVLTICVCTMCMFGYPWRPEESFRSLEMELQTVASHYVALGTETRSSGRTAHECTSSLNHHSSFFYLDFFLSQQVLTDS